MLQDGFGAGADNADWSSVQGTSSPGVRTLPDTDDDKYAKKGRSVGVTTLIPVAMVVTISLVIAGYFVMHHQGEAEAAREAARLHETRAAEMAMNFETEAKRRAGAESYARRLNVDKQKAETAKDIAEKHKNLAYSSKLEAEEKHRVVEEERLQAAAKQATAESQKAKAEAQKVKAEFSAGKELSKLRAQVFIL
eukprot:SAG11_NODE_2847_length_2910_cov_2.145500_3_plen_194_part_00